MNRSIEFYLGMSREMKALKCSEMYINVDDMDDLITRLRQTEKDAARYRCIKSIARVIECEEFDMDMLDCQDLDAMVDECIEAMKCSK